MDQSGIKNYIQNLIQPLYIKIQQLEKENSDLKKRVSALESYQTTQGNLSYMKNTASRQFQISQSRITRRDDDTRSVSGGKDKPSWNTKTKIQQAKPIVKQPVPHQKLKLKPPIPRMNSKTPTKNSEQALRQKSPPVEKIIIGGSKLQADKKQNSASNSQNSPSQAHLASPRSSNTPPQNLAESSASKGQNNIFMQIGKPTLYIQKEVKKDLAASTQKQTTPLQHSNATLKSVSRTNQSPPYSQLSKSTKSQGNTEDTQKPVTIQISN